MQWQFGAALSVVGLLAATDQLPAATYECFDPPDVSAKLGVPSAYRVVVRQDTDERTCAFSVNGIAAGSPPQEQIVDSFERLRATILFSQRDTVFTALAAGQLTGYDLAILLSSAGEGLQIELLEDAMDARLEDLANCFRPIARSEDSLIQIEFALFYMECRVDPAEVEFRVGNVVATSDLDVFSITIEDEGGTSILIWPLE